jgi:uncharacterized protein (DUF2236 family)
MRAYIEREMNRGAVVPGRGSRLVAQTILHPPLPAPLRPLWEALTFVTVGFLPPQLRRGYGIFWTPAHGAAHRSLCLGVKASRSTMPRRLRVAPIYDFAAARSRGELEARRTRGRAA